MVTTADRGPPLTVRSATGRSLYEPDATPEPQGRALIFTDLVKAHSYAALILLLVTVTFGLLTALKFNRPELLGSVEYLTWGRTRYNHTQGVLFAWLGNAFIAFCYYVIPSLTGKALTSRALGWMLFWLWNLGIVVGGWVAVALGYSQPLEWNEFPLAVDVLVVIAFAGFAVQFLLPYLRPPREPLYVASWYVVLAFTFVPLAYVVGAVAPLYVPGIQGAALSALWIHDAVGLLVTPLALAVAYYVIPTATGQPIFSHFLSMIGFWGLVFFYPLNGTHHYVFSPIPTEAQSAAIAASVFMGLVVVIVVANLLLTLRGQAARSVDYLPLRWVWLGVVFYLVVSLEGAFQATVPAQPVVHFTDWIIGHSHLAMVGFASFLVIGGLLHIWSRVTERAPSDGTMSWAFWLAVTGLTVMVVDLTVVGLMQGHMWSHNTPWIDTVTASRVGWWIRTASGLVLAAGFVVLLLGLWRSRPLREVARGR